MDQDLTNTSSKKMYQWQISMWKDAPYNFIKEMQVKKNKISQYTY